MSGPAAAEAPVLPRYGKAALCDVFPSLAAAVGAGGFANTLAVPQLHGACLLLVDGLGYDLLRAHRAQAPYLNGLADAAAAPGEPTGERPGALTVGFPSTTATSLASLGTGLAPGMHGVLGCAVAVPGTAKLLNHLRWDQPVGPHTWQPHRTVFEAAEAAGVHVHVVSAGRFRGTGLTEAALRGGVYVGAETAAERGTEILRALAAGRRRLVYAYLGDLDAAGHTHGTASPRWRAELERIDALVRDLAAALPTGTGLFITGDHGMVDVPAAARFDADTDAALAEGVALLGGENRARHVYTRPGAAADVLANWRERLGEDAWVVSREEAVDGGWFGPLSPTVRDRIGDVVAALRGDRAVVQARTSPAEARQKGMHGSLTAAEQFVPLVRVLA